MKKLLFFLVLIILFSCKKDKIVSVKETNVISKKNIQTQDSLPVKDTILKTNNIITIGFYEDFEQKLKLKFDSVSEFEYKKIDNDILFFKKSNFKQDKNYIYLEINEQLEKFKVYKNYGAKESWSGHDFIGFYGKLNLFALTNASVSENLGFSELFLIDKISGFQYSIVSIGDGSVQIPIPSPNNKFLVYCHNTEYEHQNSEIRLLKVNQNGKPENLLTEFASFGTDKFAVEKIIWISDHSFYVKGYRENYDGAIWVKNYSYYKTVF